MRPLKFHYCLAMVYNDGSSGEKYRYRMNWAEAQDWFRTQTGVRVFPYRSVRVYLCITGQKGHEKNGERVLVLSGAPMTQASTP